MELFTFCKDNFVILASNCVNKMFTRNWPAGWVFTLSAILLASCHRNVFDADDYKEIVEKAQPVENIDKSHTWELTSTYYVSVSTVGVSMGTQHVMILSGNPTQGEGAEILAQLTMTDDETKYLAFAAPSTQRQFYAALVDAAGTYTITSFRSNERSINFLEPIATKVKIDTRLVGLQAFSYCFEDEIPKPGDYDFNDVVLRISQERTADNQITLNVTLAAVGSLVQVAAGIRLVDFTYDDIESVTTLDGESFDQGYKKSVLPYIEGDNFLLKGIGDVPVVNLFEDAHWATGATAYTSEGYIPRYKYNVSKTTDASHEIIAPRTISYVVTFRNTALLDYFTLNQLDPFVICEYNGILMEEHAVYQYRTTPVLHEYTQPANATILPWALVVPSGSFRYPLDGQNIGFYKDGAMFGAYMASGHGFGEWAANHSKSTDWYGYPASNMVF